MNARFAYWPPPAAVLFSTLLPASAFADGLSVGVGMDVSLDMPDPKGTGSYSKGFAGAGLMVPIRYQLSDYAAFRATVRTAFAPGHDRVSWGTPMPSTSGEPTEVRHASTEHWAMIAAGGVTIGVEGATKDEGLAPYFGAETGPVLVNTYHSFDAESNTSILLAELDPDAQQSSGTVEPFTSKLTLLTDLHAGVRTRSEDGGMGFWAELGYSTAFVGAQPLPNTKAEIRAQRDAYGWNAIRAGFGVQFAM